MRKHLLIFAAAFSLLCAPYASVAEEAIPSSPIAKTELLVDAPTLHKDNTVWAAVKFTMPKGWHIYWQNPGDSGIPTTFAWTTPASIIAGDIQWPTPERIDIGGLMNYGYSDQVILPVPMSVNKDSASAEITVKAKWLVCHETCIPESATLTATLPQSNAIIAETRKALPTIINEKNVATYAAQSSGVSLHVDSSKLADFDRSAETHFIPAQDGIISNAAPQKSVSDAATNQLTLIMQRGSAEPLETWKGVLVNGKNSYALNAEFDAAAAPVAAMHEAPSLPFILILAFAFLGGLLLNIMPCVLPILSLKALTLVKKSAASPGLGR